MIAGKGGPVAAWPKHLPPLTVADIRELQTSLNELGYDAGTPDGIAGRRTKTALQNFQKARGFLADGYPTQEMLAAVRAGGLVIN
jgi:membrane-bound lytic murein transglycosylase B